MRTVQTRVPNIAIDAAYDRFGTKFERWKWCVCAGVLSNQLINGDPSAAYVLTSRLRHGHAREKISRFCIVAVTAMAVFLI